MKKTFALSILALGLTVGLVGPSLATPDASTRQMAANCAMCHGGDGHSRGGTPEINNLPVKYFVDQMKAFKDGSRPASVMHQHAAAYSDAEFEAMARYFATR